jgi:hypothetical protein
MAALLAVHARRASRNTDLEEVSEQRGWFRMCLRGGIGTPEPDPFSYSAAMMGCTALAQDGAIDSEEDLAQDMGGYPGYGDEQEGGDDEQEEEEEQDEDDEDGEEGEGGGRGARGKGAGEYNDEQQEDDEPVFDADHIRKNGRSYICGGLEWVHDAPFSREAKAGAGPKSYQLPPQDLPALAQDTSKDTASQRTIQRRDNLRGNKPQRWEKSGRNSFFAMSHAGGNDDDVKPPPLQPLSLVVNTVGTAMRRYEGPIRNETDPRDSCVPRGEIFSKDKDIIEIWRDTNEALLPHFARMEQAKCFPKGAPATEKKHTPPSPSEKGRYPILTPMPSLEKLQAVLPEKQAAYIMNMSYPDILKRAMDNIKGKNDEIETVRAGWAIKMLRCVCLCVCLSVAEEE